MEKEKFQIVAEKWLKLQSDVRKECVAFLKRVLKENNNHIEWDDSELDCSVSVTYDGGNHPEYASNAFSCVSAVNMDESGNITLEIEDDPRYYLDDVNTDEVYALCDFIDCELLGNE